MKLKIGDLIKIEDTTYRVPPAATRASMELFMAEEENEVTKAKREKLRMSAKGIVKRKAYGRVVAIAGELMTFENLSTEDREICYLGDAEWVAEDKLPDSIFNKLKSKRVG